MEDPKKNIILYLAVALVLFLTLWGGHIFYSNKTKINQQANGLHLATLPQGIVNKKNSSNSEQKSVPALKLKSKQAPIVQMPVKSVPTSIPVSAPSSNMQWGAYVGDGATAVSDFETLVGKKMNMVADFEDFTAPFPNQLSSAVGQQGKTLVVFWEPSTGLNTISDGSLDGEITQFAAGAKFYGYPVILVPFDEMNLNEGAWGAGMNGNTPAIFITAWDHIHDMFAGDTNVKFAIDYNNVSVPNSSDNTFVAYYPGTNYVDYVGIDGFNFGNPWKSFSQVFSSAIAEASQFNKPIYILSTGTVPGAQKASWISDMGTHIKSYSNVIGWVWFNSNSDNNWIVNTDPNSLAAFRNIVP